MKPFLSQALDRSLFAGLVFLFCLPLLLKLAMFLFPSSPLLNHDWMQNRTLGVIEPKNIPHWSLPGLASGKFQAFFADHFARHYPGREGLMRWHNEACYRLFGQSNFRLQFVIGKYDSASGGDTAYETAYLREYFLQRPRRETLQGLAQDLRRLQDACRAAGLPFALVLTPGKPSICPENVPDAWKARLNPAPRGADLFLPLLREYGVVHVDGREITQRLKAHPPTQPPLPPFPSGGTHWGSDASLATTNALLEVLRAQGLKVNPLQSESRITGNPYPRDFDSDIEGTDHDIASMLHLARPWKFTVNQIRILPEPNPFREKPSMVFIGGSFLFRPIQQLMASGQFTEIDLYYYYTESLRRLTLQGKILRLDAAHPPHFAADIFAADALVLEINEQRLPDPRHLLSFLQDALKQLPSAASPKIPFSAKAIPRLDFNRPLYYFTGAGQLAVPFSAMDGFSALQDEYVWSDGKSSSVILMLPARLPEGSRLQIESAAFLETKLPRQKVRVYCNGEKMTEWDFDGTHNMGLRPVSIPPRYLHSERETPVTLRFDIENPTSPAELGISPDQRKLGIRLRSISLETKNLPPQPAKTRP